MSDKNVVNWRHVFSPKNLLFTLAGVASAVFAFKGFMIPNHFIDGGINGISILISETFDINLAIPLVLLNIPFIAIGYYKINKTFAAQAFLAVLLLATATHFVQFQPVTYDKVLIAIFGGLFIGLGIGLVIRAGGVIDGLEILALYTRKKSKFTTNEIMITVVSVVFILLGIEFGWDKSMYSILTFFTAIKTADYVVEGFEEYTSISIVSRKEEEIKKVIVNDFKKAISVYKGERGYLPSSFHIKDDCDIIVTVVSRLETRKIQDAVFEIDPHAFIFLQTIKEVRGGEVKRKAHH
ncbi:MAG: YitT family protein [Flavobacteriales bacterium]|nr:YitT family protein [Flavobacteriales bacterium]